MDKVKKHFLFLLIIVIVGITSGVIFSNILNVNDSKIVITKVSEYFNNLKDDIEIDYLYNLLTSLKTNFIYLIVIWILGLSIIGLVINNFILFFKSFVLGFSIGSIINIYLYAGIILASLYIFPALIINIIVYGILTFFANDFSIKLFKVLFMKKEIHFHILIKRYFKILLYSSIILIFSSLLETFLMPFLIKLFSFLIK